MSVLSLNCDDIDEFVCGTSDDDWHADYIQLSPGKLKFQARIVELPGITLLWNHFGARMRISEAYLGDTVIFGTVFPAEKPFLYRGHEFQPKHAVIQHPGSEHHYVVPENLDSLIIHSERSLLADSGLQLSATVEMKIPGHALQALVTECRSATQIVAQLKPTGKNEILVKMLRNKILTRLRDALTPWSAEGHQDNPGEPRCSRDYLLFRKAENAMQTIGLGSRPSIDRLADLLDVSKRTLFYAFNSWVGMGPNAYFETLRLHYVRDRLLAGHKSTTRITDVANELGFNHLGRFSGDYYRFFGEYPNETLHRREH